MPEFNFNKIKMASTLKKLTQSTSFILIKLKCCPRCHVLQPYVFTLRQQHLAGLDFRVKHHRHRSRDVHCVPAVLQSAHGVRFEMRLPLSHGKRLMAVRCL